MACASWVGWGTHLSDGSRVAGCPLFELCECGEGCCADDSLVSHKGPAVLLLCLSRKERGSGCHFVCFLKFFFFMEKRVAPNRVFPFPLLNAFPPFLLFPYISPSHRRSSSQASQGPFPSYRPPFPHKATVPTLHPNIQFHGHCGARASFAHYFDVIIVIHYDEFKKIRACPGA